MSGDLNKLLLKYINLDAELEMAYRHELSEETLHKLFEEREVLRATIEKRMTIKITGVKKRSKSFISKK